MHDGTRWEASQEGAASCCAPVNAVQPPVLVGVPMSGRGMVHVDQIGEHFDVAAHTLTGETKHYLLVSGNLLMMRKWMQ